MEPDIELNDRERRVDRRFSFRRSPMLSSNRRMNTLATIRDAQDSLTFANFQSLTDDEKHEQDALVKLVVGDSLIKGSLATSCIWYTRYLRYQLFIHWHLFAPTLIGLNSESVAPKQGDLVVAYKCLSTIALLLKTESGVALAEIVDGLDNEGQLKEQLDGERALPNQLVFTAMGWLTMLYEAVNRPEPDRLELTRTTTNSCGRKIPMTTRKIWSHSLSFDYVDRPLDYLFGKFGDLIPGPKAPSPAERSESIDFNMEAITVSTICFNHLHSIVELKIEWVSSLALHMELNSGKKTLKLFQYPSFCRMMAAEDKNGLLSRLINDHAANNCEDVNTPDVPAAKFFREMLLTYRLIFGLDEKSWKAGARMLNTMEERQTPGEPSIVWDPLLQTLCGKSESSDEAQCIYDDLEASEPAPTYPYSEFPFFGKRLTELQKFVEKNQPRNVRALLSDKSDVAAWYQLWNNQILVFFATFTIFLMMLSFILQVWQVILARQQLEQGMHK